MIWVNFLWETNHACHRDLSSLKAGEGSIFFFLIIKKWSIVNLQFCVSFKCRAKWLVTYIFFFRFFFIIGYYKILNMVPGQSHKVILLLILRSGQAKARVQAGRKKKKNTWNEGHLWDKLELGTLKCVKENKLKLMLTEREKDSSLLSQEG